ncbi:MAG: M48 family metalloprotease [Pseudomonadota bacterium]|nr:M48 family metalloprotease [Pseudomonadota bacterium]MDQ3160830.1 M48 family metalloprotease [Pseudomonadota bacterium]
MRTLLFSSSLLFALLLGIGTTAAAGAAGAKSKPTEPAKKLVASSPQPAVIRKSSVDVHAGPDLASPTVTTLKRESTVNIVGQDGLWFQLVLADGKAGFVRVNDVRMAYAGKETGGAARALFSGKAGKGRVSETAGVRGLDESDLKAATFNGVQLAKLESYRVTPEAAAKAAKAKGWTATTVAYVGEFKPKESDGQVQASQGEKRGKLRAARGFLSSALGGVGGSLLGAAEKVIPKSEQMITEEERALGPELTGRILGAAPLWKDDAAQRRINLIGRWQASQTSRPDLPWTFGIINSGEINAFAAPGGYILLTRGLYQLLSDDAEVAAVLGHEISHVVQRDHYAVIHKQEMMGAGKEIAMSQVGGGNLAASMAKDYVAKHGAMVMMTSLDRGAEYRSDEASAIYLARGGFNPLALYAVLQKMTALGTASAELAQLYKTHPPLDERMDRIDRSSYKGLEQYTRRE